MESEQISIIKEQQRLGGLMEAGRDFASRLVEQGVTVVMHPLHYMAQKFPADGTWWVCAIGHAALGNSNGNFQEALQSVRKIWVESWYCERVGKFAELLGVSEQIIQRVEYLQIWRGVKIDTLIQKLNAGNLTRMRVGVVGYCPPTEFNEIDARRMIDDAYNRIAAHYMVGHEITIVSGLTAVGVRNIAYDEAVKRGWKTVGVACKRALEHTLYPVDEQVIVGEDWGDESEAFLEGLDAIVRIGMGKQSIRETNAIRAQGKPTFEYDLPAL